MVCCVRVQKEERVETEREGIQRGKTGSEYMYKAERETSFVVPKEASIPSAHYPFPSSEELLWGRAEQTGS
jgi:hypothetical protein